MCTMATNRTSPTHTTHTHNTPTYAKVRIPIPPPIPTPVLHLHTPIHEQSLGAFVQSPESRRTPSRQSRMANTPNTTQHTQHNTTQHNPESLRSTVVSCLFLTHWHTHSGTHTQQTTQKKYTHKPKHKPTHQHTKAEHQFQFPTAPHRRLCWFDCPLEQFRCLAGCLLVLRSLRSRTVNILHWDRTRVA
jgi:hypothetical protein